MPNHRKCDLANPPTYSEPLCFRDHAGWIIMVLNALTALHSTWFFVGVLKTGVDGWLMMNTCAPSILLFVGGFLAASPTAMVAASVLMFRYGTLGLFVFNWHGPNLIAQASHLIMTVAVGYIGVKSWRVSSRQHLARGGALGLALLVGLGIAQHDWFAAHPGLLEQLFSGSYSTR